MCKTENEHFKKVKFEARFQSSMEIIYSSNTPSMTRQTGNVSITVGRGADSFKAIYLSVLSQVSVKHRISTW